MDSAKRAHRRNKALCWIVGVLVLFLAILLAANTSLTYVIIDVAKETVTSATGALQVKGSSMIASTRAP